MNQGHFCQLSVRPSDSADTPNPSGWEKFSRIIREFTTISENYPIRKYYFRSLKAYQDERKKHTQGEYWSSIHPFSSFQYYRQILMAFVYVGVVVGDQIDIAFLTQYRNFVCKTDIYILIINIIALIDLILNFFTGYVQHQEKMNIHYYTGYYKTAETATVLSTRRIAFRYLRTFFIVDIFCAFNIIHLLMSYIPRNEAFYYTFACFRHLRVIRIYTVEQTGNIILTNERMKYDIIIILKCIFLFSFFSLFFGTMLIYVPTIFGYIYNENRYNYITRLELYYNKMNLTITDVDILMHSTFDAFCLLTIFQTKEVGKTVEIYIIVICTMIVGNILKIYVFISMYLVLKKRYQSRINYLVFMQEVKHFVDNLNLSKSLGMDIYNYFDTKLKKEYFIESEIKNTLQRNMQYEIFSQSSMGLIRNCHLFRNLPHYFVIQLSLRLKCETYVPGVTIIQVGEIATCMYFIATGTVAVYSANGEELCHLTEGEYVGEIGILQSTARVADIVTIEYCELYRLDIKDFQEVIRPSSKFYERIYKIAMKRMNVHAKQLSTNN